MGVSKFHVKRQLRQLIIASLSVKAAGCIEQTFISVVGLK